MIRKSRLEKMQLEKVLTFVNVPLPQESGVPQEYLNEYLQNFVIGILLIAVIGGEEERRKMLWKGGQNGNQEIYRKGSPGWAHLFAFKRVRGNWETL